MKNKIIEDYLSDLDNLLDCGFFSEESIKDFSFYHKDMSLKEFISHGRELLRLKLIEKSTPIMFNSGFEIKFCPNTNQQKGCATLLYNPEDKIARYEK